MKVLVINFSGNVGKSTIAAHMLKPRMNKSTLFSVESLNNDASSDGVEVETYKGKEYKELLEEVIMTDNAIVDVGASNAEFFCNLMNQYKGSSKVFDYYLIPTIKDKKQSNDTLKTISSLLLMGIPKRKIRVIFNRVEIDDDVKTEFNSLFKLITEANSLLLDENYVIYNNAAFNQSKEYGISLADILDDKTDYSSLAKESKKNGNETEARLFVNKLLLRMAALTANENLESVFNAIFGIQDKSSIPKEKKEQRTANSEQILK